jgi:hypothetical protein
MDSTKQQASGRINVASCDSKPYDESGDFTISEVNITEEFSGDLVGVGSSVFDGDGARWDSTFHGNGTLPGGTQRPRGVLYFSEFGNIENRRAEFNVGNNSRLGDERAGGDSR